MQMIKGEKDYEYLYKYRGRVVLRKSIKDSREKQITILNNLNNRPCYRKPSNIITTNALNNKVNRNEYSINKKIGNLNVINKYIKQETNIYTKKIPDAIKEPKNENKEIKKSFSRYKRNYNFEYQYRNQAFLHEKIILNCKEIKAKNILRDKSKNNLQSRKSNVSENEIKNNEDRENKKEIRLKYLSKEKSVKKGIDNFKNNLKKDKPIIEPFNPNKTKYIEIKQFLYEDKNKKKLNPYKNSENISKDKSDNKKLKFQNNKLAQSSIKKFQGNNIIELKEEENKIRKNKEKKINNNVEITLGEKRKRESKKVYENEEKNKLDIINDKKYKAKKYTVHSSKEKNNELNQKFKELEDKLNNQEKEKNNELNQKIKELEDKLNNQEKEKEKNNELNQKIKELENRLIIQEKEIDDKNYLKNKNEKLQKELKESKENITLLLNEKNNNKNEILLLKEKISKIEKENIEKNNQSEKIINQFESKKEKDISLLNNNKISTKKNIQEKMNEDNLIENNIEYMEIYKNESTLNKDNDRLFTNDDYNQLETEENEAINNNEQKNSLKNEKKNVITINLNNKKELIDINSNKNEDKYNQNQNKQDLNENNMNLNNDIKYNNLINNISFNNPHIENDEKSNINNENKKFNEKKIEIIKNEEESDINDENYFKIYGFENRGNNCYLNSSLQLLTRIKELKNEILNYEKKYEVKKDNNTQGQLFFAFKKIIEKIEKSRNDKLIIDPHELKYIMGSIDEIYYHDHQEDSNEFILNFFDALFDETKNKLEEKDMKKIKDLKIENKEDIEAYSKFYNRFYIKKGYSFLIDIFYGISQTKKYCTKCNNQILNKFNSYNMLELPIYELAKKNRNKSLDINEIINEYKKEKKLDFKCKNCDSSGHMKIKTLLYTFPKYLIIFFPRTVNDEYISKNIIYNEILCIQSEYKYDDNKTYKYSLECVVEHSGGINFGHYTALCPKDKKNNKWYRFSDSYCDQYNNGFHSKNAIILLYKSFK